MTCTGSSARHSSRQFRVNDPILAAAIVAVLILGVAVPAVVINRDVIFKWAGRSRRSSDPILAFRLDREATAAFETALTPAWPLTQRAATAATSFESGSTAAQDRTLPLQPAGGLADMEQPVGGDYELDELQLPPIGSWVDSPPVNFHWPVSPERAG